MIPANLIINADDFGLDRRVSQGIALCVEKGLINSFSVLPFDDPFHDGLLKSLVAGFPGVRIGSHLSLMDAPSRFPVGHGDSGLREHPNHYRDFLKLYLLGRYPPSRIYREWKAQILFLGKYLGGPDRLAHLDSHQHLHVLPGIWPVAAALQKEFGIPRLRVPYESLALSLFYKPPFGLAMQALAAFRAAGSPKGSPKGDRRRMLGFFTSTRFTLEANLKGLQKVVARPDRDFELMVHPALPPDPDHPEPVDPAFPVVHPGQVREIEELARLQEFFRSLPVRGRAATGR